MKTVLAVSLMTILAVGVIAPALNEAYALKADNSSKLSPKSFGDKTKIKIANLEHPGKSGFELIKKQEMNSFKKIAAEYKAKQIMKSLYKLG